MELEEIFKRLGLRRHAAAVYRALEQHAQPLLVAPLAAKTKLARQQVYRSLAELSAHGFVKIVKVGKRCGYVAAPFSRIQEAFADTLSRVQRTSTSLEMRFFKGFQGIRAVFDDVIEHTPKGDTFYRYTSERDLEKVNRYLSPTYRARRDKKKLERLVISNPVSGRQKKPRLERFSKYLAADVPFEQNIIQLVYGSRLAFINLTSEEAFVIEDEALASFQKTIFRQLYRKL